MEEIMDFKRCTACGRKFLRCPQVPGQRYCSTLQCQRERRRRSQRAMRQHDPDYKDNQSRAQKAWSKRNPNYWREYRRTHPKCLERNRRLQRERNRKSGSKKIAKMVVSAPNSPAPSGIYRLVPVGGSEIAKMDAWTVEITFLSNTYAPSEDDCKERT
jgi:hypothetical protein